jgi:cytochrome c biogenesis protein CcdA
MENHILLLTAIYFAILALVVVGIAIFVARRVRERRRLERIERIEDDLRHELEEALRRSSF